jgi:TPR repeat protein
MSLLGQIWTPRRECEYCGGDATLKCTRCLTLYCSAACQARAWPLHKGVCFFHRALDVLDQVDEDDAEFQSGGREPRDVANGSAAGRARLAEAVALFRKSAEAGYPDALYELSTLVEKGHGCDADPVEYRYLVREGARRGHTTACLIYGRLLRDGRSGVKADPARAVEYFTVAAAKGHDQAAIALYVMYKFGRHAGVKADEAEAARWLARAYELRNHIARRIVAGEDVMEKDES